jgi:hypothetical protein
MKPRLYFDTSVFGGVYDEEFEQENKDVSLIKITNRKK